MLERPRRLTPLVVALAGGALATCLLPSPAGAESAGRLGALRAHGVGLDRSVHRALLELYARESSLSQARAEATRLAGVAAALLRRQAALTRRAAVVRRSLAVAHDRLAETLRLLYADGGPNPIAVVLGATSVDEAIVGLDNLESAAVRNMRLASDLRSRLVRLRRLESALAARRAATASARRHADDAVARLTALVGARRAFVASLRGRARPEAAHVSELERSARAAARASDGLVREAPSPPAAKLAAPGLLTVDAAAYHLPGRTASGLPVGLGVVAVDPAVIPLGTRLFIPGYGPAVAADVGSGVRGNLIDLWFPSTQQARAWGRRTVTVTIYR